MGKKKPPHMSLFSTFIQHDSKLSSNEYHLIDNEYFAAFDSLDHIQQFHDKLPQSISPEENLDLHPEQDDNEMNMKSFAEQFLIDLPEQTSSQELFSTDQPINWSPKVKTIQSLDNNRRKQTTPIKLNNKKQRRHSPELHSSTNTFDSSQDEPNSSNKIQLKNIDSILHTLNSPTDEQSIIKNEPIESEQLNIEPKEESIELNMSSLDFNSSEYPAGLDNYVQNIHLSTTRPKRIRKRKKFYIDESEIITRPKKILRKKRPPPPPPSQIFNPSLLTDAEIEQQFGERLPIVKSEDETQQIINSRVIIEIEPVSHLSELDKARAKLTTALRSGHDPDTYLLKIRSREHKIIEVQLAIYGTADWHSHRMKILSKIEEALRGLRVSWTKIDIRVDHFDIRICTSPQTASISPPTSLSNNNSSWFLKVLSESSPLIVHIHDRRYPQQRHLIKCSCPQCSPIDSSLPLIVNVSPATTPRRLIPPTILNKTPQTNMSSLHNIDTTFFNELIHQWGRNTVISATQCVLDLALIVSVHTSLANLCVPPNYSHDEYKQKYQQVIDPLKCTINDNEQILLSISVNSKNNTQSVIIPKSPDILTFYNSIKQNKANIRSAKSMRNLITSSFSSSNIITSSPSNVIKGRTLILPKPSTTTTITQPLMTLFELKKFSSRSRRRSSQTNRYDKHTRIHLDNNNDMKQQAHCTPIIELKPIMGGSTITTQNIHSFIRGNDESIIIRDAQNNELKKVMTIISTNTEQNETITTPQLTNSARVIRLSITKPALTYDVNSSAPLVPKQINIIKPLSSSIAPAVKLSNPILISNKSQAPLKLNDII